MAKFIDEKVTIDTNELMAKLPRDADGYATLSRELVDVIVRLIQLEFTTARNATYVVGIWPPDFNKWTKQGRHDMRDGKRTLEAYLCLELERAIAERNRTLSKYGGQAARMDGRLAVDMLRILSPEEWDERQRESKDEGPPADEDEIKKQLAALQKR